MEKKNILINVAILVITFIAAKVADQFLGAYVKNIINLAGVYVTLAVSLNLINGFTGLFSLGHVGFMAIGAYITALLTMPEAAKTQNFFMVPINPLLQSINLPLPLALLLAGIIAAFFGLLIAAPVLRLTDDYLAIASLGFAEIIRILILNMPSITNGALGLIAIPKTGSLAWSWVIAALTFVLISMLVKSSYGKAILAIREDEIAAKAMGINVFRTKLISFCTGSFFAGVGGGLLATHMGTIDSKTFTFALTFNILLMVVLGGMGNLKGSALAAVVITYLQEWLRFLDQPLKIGSFTTQAMPGLRMVVFSLMLMIVILFKKDDRSLPKLRKKGGEPLAKN